MSSIAIRERRPRRLRTLGLGLAAGTLLVWSAVAQAAAPESFSGLAKKVTPAVVNIASSHETTASSGQIPPFPFQFPEGSPFEKFFRDFRNQMGPQGKSKPEHQTVTGLGSGFIIDPSGYVVTNNHVVDGATKVTVRLEDNSVYQAKIVGVDPQTDLALLKIDAKRTLPSVEFGNSDKAEVGDWVMAVGNPFGLGGSVTAGIVSARGRNIDAGPYDDFLQIDAPINKGNSGGPLFGLNGQVMGINTAIYSPNGGSVGIGFAIPSNVAKPVIAQLRKSGNVERGWLGVEIQKMSPEIADAVGLKSAKGVIVAQVSPDSPAATAGLKRGDIILSFAGKDVASPRALARVVAKNPAGSKRNMTIWRERSEKTLSVVTGHQPSRAKVAQGKSGSEEDGSHHSADLNADLAQLTPERRAEFRIPDDLKGVLVLDVKSGSVLEQGLRPGDIIEQVDQTPVSTPDDVDRLVHKAKSKSRKSVLLLVKRQGHDLFIGLKLGVA